MTSKSLLSKAGLIACLAIFVSISVLGFGQQLTGTLTGTTTDSTGAVVTNAKVTMKNELSGDIRTTVSNSTGYFSITAVQPGTYTVTIEAPGFKIWKQAGIAFAQGDNRNLPQISLTVGATTETVEISAGALSVPTDNAEISTTVPQQMVDSFPMGGRDAGELLKIMPGMAFTNYGSTGSGFSDKVVGTNTGPIGQFSSNGTQPNGAMAYMLDGANLVDPGNAGTQIANINQDMVSEVKVLMSDYSAEYAKGPVIFQAFSKSGGQKYHGEGYFYARNSALNAIDAYAHSQIVSGATTAALAAPAESYYYMGGNLGGPIPFLSKGRQKLFFWGGYEYMKQKPAGAIINYNIPTVEQLGGDFSNTTINGVPGTTQVSTGNTLAQQLNSAWGFAYGGMYAPPPGTTNNIIPTTDFDPNASAYAKLLPKANVSPSAGNGWSNYQYVSSVPQNRWEATGKVDYAIGDNTKLSGSYTRQIEADQHPVGIWWTPPWTLPYPSSVVANTTSQEVMANLTHVFSPTTTNEAVFTLARYINPNTLGNAKAVSRSALGMTMKGLFGNTTDQMPNLIGPWGGTFPDVAEMNLDGNFAGKGFGKEAIDPSVYDNYTKVIGSHTIKLGAYWDTSKNIQTSSGIFTGANGQYNLGWGPVSSGNVVADFLVGNIANYNQPNQDINNTIQDHQWAIYAQDSYKANRQLTVSYGLRFDHMGQWYGSNLGMAVWDPASYVNGTPVACSTCSPVLPGPTTNPNTGMLWHGTNSSIPTSGWTSPLFYFEPRVGIAYDVFGNGKTVIRGGFASFRYQVAVNDVGGAYGLAQGIFTATDYNFKGYNAINSFTPPSTNSANGGSISVMQRGDNRTPYTNDWNISVAESLPWRSVFEISYVGNQSRNELLNGANGKVDDLNAVQTGGYFYPDQRTVTYDASGNPVYQPNGTALYLSPGAPACNNGNAQTDYAFCGSQGPNFEPLSANYGGSNPVGMTGKVSFQQNDYRALTNYTDIYLITHGSYANYNAMQVSWKKQSGPVNFLLNYTFGKVMGIKDGQSDNGATNGVVWNPFVLKANYGPLDYDTSQIFNATYVWNLPKFIHGNRIVEGAVNGWQLSGYSTYQSGHPLQDQIQNVVPGGMTVPLAGAPDLPDNSLPLPNGLRTVGVNNGAWYGTDQAGGGYENFAVQVTCDPRNHGKGQYFNPNCFTVPAMGQLGTVVWPYAHLPAYFDSDLGLYKSFKITESKQVQFRVQATNFLNHPVPQFGLGGVLDEQLNFQHNYSMTENNLAECQLLVNSSATAPCTVNLVGLATTNQNSTLTGKPGYKTGQRVLTFSAKFYF
jgi:hypothetical protein